MSDQPDSLAAALAILQTNLPEIRKSKRADVPTAKGTYSYTYADLAPVTKAIMPLMGALGLSFIAKPTLSGEKFVLAYSLTHAPSGDREDGEYPLPTTGTPQAIGSAITYGRRYCLCAITGIAPEDDDDGAAAEAEVTSLKGTAQRRRQPAARQPVETKIEPKRTAQRASARSAGPPLPGEEGFEKPGMAANGDGPTDRQLTLIHTLFTNIGWTERDDRLNAASVIVGRKMGSSKELTKSEASRLIDELEPIAKSEDPQGAMLDRITPAEGS